ncbi:MAG: hypothetical protein ACW98D_20890 [Promethearchaeota archaeon]|jgi:hypothetical protein
MDSKAFISSIEDNLVTLAPITKFIISKQLNDLKFERDSMSPDQAIEFIEKMTNALIMCLGNDGSQLARKMMMKQLRTYAPGYFENQGVGNNTSSSV